MAEQDGLCLAGCGRPAVACDECRRALAMIDGRSGFAAISRHPEGGRGCRLCAAGAPEHCVEHLLAAALAYRAELLGSGAIERATVDQLATPAWQEWPGWWAWGGIAGEGRGW